MLLGPCLQVDLAQQPLNIPKNGKVSCDGRFSSRIHFKTVSFRYSTWEFNKKYTVEILETSTTLAELNHLDEWKINTNNNYWIFLEDSLIDVSSPWDSASYFSYSKLIKGPGVPYASKGDSTSRWFERNHERRVASSNWIYDIWIIETWMIEIQTV